MRKKTLSLFLFLPSVLLLLLAGCSQNSSNSASEGSSSISTSSGGIPVSLSMTDDPPSGVTILFFQISITSASLTPASGSANVSLLNNNTPIQVDVTQLQALSAFLNTTNVPAGSYNSLNLGFSNPQLVIFNASDQSIASSCAVNTVCQLTPTIDNSTSLNLSSAPFPITIAANTPLGFLIDFHLNNVVQPDLSVNLGVSNGVTVSELPPTPPSGPPQFGFLTGTVESVNTSQNQFTLQTAWGSTFTIDSNGSTAYDDFPSSVCTSGSISCLAAGQIVQVQVASVASRGVLTAAQVSYLQAAGEQTAEGSIVGLSTSNGATIMKLILHRNPTNNQGLPLGGMAAVTIAGGATFSVDSNGFTIPSGLSFTAASSLFVGQEVQVNVAAGSLSPASSQNQLGPWGPPPALSFTTNSVELEPSQITGTVTAINSSGSSFTLGPNFFFAPALSSGPAPAIDVETTSQTSYQGFNPQSFSGLATKNIVSVNGWLFPPASNSAPPVLAAESVVLRPNGMF